MVRNIIFLILVVVFDTGCKLRVRRVDGCNPSASAPIVEAVYPVNGARWMDYVKKSVTTTVGSGSTLYNQPDVACAGTETGYFSCIHGGEKLKVRLTGIASCSGVTASDQLEAFDWVCDDLTGTATLYSSSLKKDKGLRDLVSASDFIPNRVIASGSGECSFSATSESARWWSNTVTPLPANPGAGDPALALSSAGTIYTLSSSTTSTGYNLAADRIAVVTLGSSVMQYSGNPSAHCNTSGELQAGTDRHALVCSGTQKFVWIEIRGDGQAATTANGMVLLSGVSFARVHGTWLKNGDLTVYDGAVGLHGTSSSLISSTRVDGSRFGFFLNGNAGSNLFLSSQASRSAQNGWQLLGPGVDKNTIYGSVASQSVSGGMSSDSGATENNYVLSSAISTGMSGFASWNPGERNLFFAITASHSGGGPPGSGYGYVGNNGGEATIVNIVATNNKDDGLNFGASSTGNQIFDALATNNGTGVRVQLTSPTNLFYGDLTVGNNSLADCLVGADSAAGTLLDASCNHGVGLALPATIGASAESAFFGRVLSDDTSNPSDSDGGAAFGSITSFLSFDNPFRGWGIEPPGAFMAVASQGYCAAGNCRIYDFRVSSSDTLLRNFYGTFVPGGACPASVNAANAENVITDLSLSPRKFLKAAVELMDGTGNGNGLCESGESCIFTPNRGSYAGEGGLHEQSCVFSGGNGVIGVNLRAYTRNGA